jgi:hypothetical protein
MDDPQWHGSIYLSKDDGEVLWRFVSAVGTGEEATMRERSTTGVGE